MTELTKQSPLTAEPQRLNFGPYMCLADEKLKLISVFDDLKYDRSDLDMMSPAMRQHAIKHLKPLEFKQVSGNVLLHKDSNIRCLIPKFHALGASPFDIIRYTPREKGDFYILTPTQTACQYVDHYSLDEAVEKAKALIIRQPINLYKILDYLEHKPRHQEFSKAIGHLRLIQREAVASDPLKTRRALGSMV